MFIGADVIQSNEAAPHVHIKLCDIPPFLNYNSISYKLRGVLNYHKSKSQLRNSIGHYAAFAKREEGNWELFDDLKKKPMPINGKKEVACELLMYTI